MDSSAPPGAFPPTPDERLREGLLALAERLGLAVDPGGFGVAPGVRATVRAARRAGLPASRRRTTWAGLARATPALAILSDGNSVLVTAVEERDGTLVAVLEAPGAGARAGAVDRRRFEAAWTGEVVLLRRPPAPDGWRLTRRSLTRLLLGEPRLLRDLCGATAGVALLSLVPVLFVQLALARVLPHHGRGTLEAALAILAAALLAEVALRALAAFCAGRLAARWRARLSVAVTDRLLRLPPSAVDPSGDLRSRLTTFEAAHRTLLDAAPRALLDATMAAVALPLLFVLDWPVALVALGVLGLVALASTQVAQRLRRAMLDRVEREGRLDAALLRTTMAPRAVKELGLEAERLAEWENLAGDAALATAATARIRDRFAASLLPLDRLAVLGALAAGVLVPAVAGGPVPLPALLAAVLLVQRLALPLRRLPDLLAAALDARIARRRLAEVLNQPREEGGVLAVLEGAVALEHVGVRYPGALRPALDGVSATIPAGGMVGVFGPSGAGKSTLVRLLARAALPTSGVVRLDGRDVRGLDVAALRRQVLVVTARDTIFAGTVRDAITIRRPDATFAEMTEAARIAGLDEVVERLPRGYETSLAAGAPSLSAGQRQRLVLARALVTRPAILVLDEALSAIDPQTEDGVVARLRQARMGATTILVSHRVGSLAGLDSVLVLADGRLVDHGTPADLAERCDLFRDAAMRESAADAGDVDRAPRVLALG